MQFSPVPVPVLFATSRRNRLEYYLAYRGGLGIFLDANNANINKLCRRRHINKIIRRYFEASIWRIDALTVGDVGYGTLRQFKAKERLMELNERFPVSR
jgi:hypothetical protein